MMPDTIPAIETLMRTSAVIPVLVIDDAATARPLAEALVAGGLRVLEVTLRTPAALDAIREMKQVPGAIVGAGTVVSTEQFEEVMAAGAEFIVSPGLTERLARPIIDSDVPFLPGVATAGDIMRALPPMSFLPDRRDHRGQRNRLAGVQAGAVRRRQLGNAGRRLNGRGGSEGARGGGVARLNRIALAPGPSLSHILS